MIKNIKRNELISENLKLFSRLHYVNKTDESVIPKKLTLKIRNKNINEFRKIATRFKNSPNNFIMNQPPRPCSFLPNIQKPTVPPRSS